MSTLIYQSTGVAGWLGVAFLAGLAIGLFRNQRYTDLPWRASGAVLSILSLAMLCTLFMPSFIPRPLWGPGGLGGTLVADMATRHLASAGAALAALTVLGVGLFLTADRLVVRVLRFSVGLLTHLGERIIRFLQYTLLRVGVLSDSSTKQVSEPEWWQRRRSVTPDTKDSEEQDDGDIAIKVRGRKPTPVVCAEEEYEEEGPAGILKYAE